MLGAGTVRAAAAQVKEGSLEITEVEKLFLEEVHSNLTCERQRGQRLGGGTADRAQGLLQ